MREVTLVLRSGALGRNSLCKVRRGERSQEFIDRSAWGGPGKDRRDRVVTDPRRMQAT